MPRAWVRAADLENVSRAMAALRGAGGAVSRGDRAVVSADDAPGSAAGGHLVWVEMPPAVDAIRLYDEALEQGISIGPGPLFSASGGCRSCIRLNMAVSWSPRVEQALQTLGRLARRQESAGR